MYSEIVNSYEELSLIDVSPLISGDGDLQECARKINDACRLCGFFRIKGHGVDEEL